MPSDDKLKLVKIEPGEQIEFLGKIDDTRIQTLKITNGTKMDVAFKLKGTSPDVIKLKPGYGYLKPGNSVSVQVKLLPLRDRPRAPAKERLTVLLAVAPKDRPMKPSDLWRREKGPPDSPVRHEIAIKIEGFEGFKPTDNKASPSSNKTPKKGEKQKKRKRRKVTSRDDQDDEVEEASEKKNAKPSDDEKGMSEKSSSKREKNEK